MEFLILIAHVLIGAAVCGLVLLQHGKGADMGAAFGSGSAGSLFGASGSANFLSRATAVLATIFFVSSLGLAYLAGSKPKADGSTVMDAVKQRPTGRPLRLVVGIDDVLPKEIAQALIEPALGLKQPVRLLCREGNLETLLAALALHELDVVLSDTPVTPSLNVRAYNHPLGECGVLWMGSPALAKAHRRRFPKSLDGAPMCLPTDDTAIRSHLGMNGRWRRWTASCVATCRSSCRTCSATSASPSSW